MNEANYSLRIDMTKQRASSPFLFGHNLEHTRACVSGGLSAQLLRNRKFAGRPGARTGVSAEWFGIGARAFFCNDRDPYVSHFKPNGMWRRNETNAQTVQNPIEGQLAGIGQGGLFIRPDIGYKLAIVAKANRPVALTARLTNPSGDETYAQARFELSDGDWQRCEATLSVSKPGGETCLRLAFAERATVIFGAVSLLPEDSFHGMRRDVVDRLRELGVGLLRWPGGNFAGEYRWQDMFLPVDRRAPLQAFTEDETQPYTHGYDMHEIDTDDFVALCREIGAEPFITINLAWDAPEACAAWVEYCNGPADSEYGRLRARRGHEKPYNVRFWSLGNEMGYGHMEGPMQPDQYAVAAGAAARAMLEKDPALTLCSSGPYESDRAAAWIEGSARALLPLATHISFHTYNNFPQDFTAPETIRLAYERAVSVVNDNRAKLRALRAALPKDIHISYDEWNVWAAWFRKSSAVEGMFVASMLHMMLYAGDELNVPLLCFFQPVGEGAVDVFPDRAALSADGQAFALMKAHKGGRICAIEGLADYEAVASVKEGILSVSLINADYDAPARFTLNACGPVTAARCLEARDLLPDSHFEESGLTVTEREGTACVSLPPRAIALLQFSLPAPRL
ncbi:MAG: hypothetical protein IKS52_00015 [Clostridia bacterium]|nr:hypothetical protein [Clostridia bacterium]